MYSFEWLFGVFVDVAMWLWMWFLQGILLGVQVGSIGTQPTHSCPSLSFKMQPEQTKIATQTEKEEKRNQHVSKHVPVLEKYASAIPFSQNKTEIGHYNSDG